jgi:L-malate glycosyltransferase
MKIGIHNQPAGSSPGGCECCVAVLAEALAPFASVEIVHHRSDMTRDQLAALSATDLTPVALRYEPSVFDVLTRNQGSPRRLLREMAAWHDRLSKPYDLFITFTHDMPPACVAPHGVFVALFPMPTSRLSLPLTRPRQLITNLLTNIKRAYWYWRFRDCKRTYQCGIAISEFARTWTRRVWGADCRVISPPVDIDFPSREKENLILSVGRFAVQGARKRQWEMAGAFGEMVARGLVGWQYDSVGGLGSSPEDREYHAKVLQASAGLPMHVDVNLLRANLRNRYAQAKLFWHAAGYGDDPDVLPELSEHFGIATVEAMAAGCVPIAINQGAQLELIEHGVSGFLWRTLGELKDYTLQVIHDEGLRIRLSEAARARANAFSRENFVNSYLDLLRPLLPAQARERHLTPEVRGD